MTLVEWAQLRYRALFDVDYYTVTRGWDAAGRRLKWYVVFTNPLPYQARVFSKLEQVAEFLGKPIEEIEGRVYSERDIFRSLKA